MTIPFASLWPQSLLPSGLTAGGVIAVSSMVGAAEAAPTVTLVSVALGLTALALAFARRRRPLPVAVVARSRRQIRTVAWSPP